MRSASYAFILKSVGAVVAFGFNIVLARRLGPEGTGLFYLVVSVVTIASVLARLGQDNALLRIVAPLAGVSHWPRVRGIVAMARKNSAIAGLVATLACVALAVLVAGAIDDGLRLPLAIGAVAIVPLTLAHLHASALKGVQRIPAAMFVEGVGVPFFSLAAFLILAIVAPPSSTLAALAYVVAAFVVAGLSFALWQVGPTAGRGQAGFEDVQTLRHAVAPLLWIAALNLIMVWASTLLLGVFHDSTAVGVFGVATRVAALVNFVLLAVNSTMAPRYAAAHANGDRRSLETLAHRTVALTTVASLPALLLFMLAPGPVLSIFGPEFVGARYGLVILSAGQLVNVATGSVGYLLMMSGHERLLRNAITFAAVGNLVLNLALVPAWGVLGAAIATAASLAGLNIASAFFVARSLGIRPVPWPSVTTWTWGRS